MTNKSKVFPEFQRFNVSYIQWWKKIILFFVPSTTCKEGIKKDFCRVTKYKMFRGVCYIIGVKTDKYNKI